MIFSLILNLPIKRPSVQKTLHSSAIRLVCSYRPTNRQYMYIYIFASQGLRFGSPFSPPLADLEYILRIRALIFHWLRLPVHVSNQKTFYTEHMLSTKCKQRWYRNALIWQRFATSRFGSNENIFPVCQSFEAFTWLTVSASKLKEWVW